MLEPSSGRKLLCREDRSRACGIGGIRSTMWRMGKRPGLNTFQASRSTTTRREHHVLTCDLVAAMHAVAISTVAGGCSLRVVVERASSLEDGLAVRPGFGMKMERNTANPSSKEDARSTTTRREHHLLTTDSVAPMHTTAISAAAGGCSSRVVVANCCAVKTGRVHVG